MAEQVLHAEIRAEATGGETIDRVREETERLHASLAHLRHEELHETALLGRLAEGFALVSEHSEGLRDHAFELRNALGENGETIGELIPMLGALGAAASVGGLLEMTHEAAEAHTQLAAMAETLGLTIGQLQGLQYAARATDVPIDAMQHGILLLDRNMTAAASGKSKDVAEIFHRMGISLRGADGHLRSTQDVLPLLAESLSRTHDVTLRNAVAMALFGRSGAELIPLLLKGKAGIEDLEATSRRLNASFSDEDNENIERYKNAWTDLDTAFGGLKDTITADVAPVLTPFLQGITDWVANHRDDIGKTIASDLDAIGRAVKSVDWKAVEADIGGVARVLNEGAQDLGGWVRIAEVFAGLSVLKFAWGLAQPLVEMAAIGVEAGKLSITLTEKLAKSWGIVGAAADAAAVEEELAASMSVNGQRVAAGEQGAARGPGGAHAPEAAPKGPRVNARRLGEVTAVVPVLGALYELETDLAPLMRYLVHLDGSTDVAHPNARGYTGPTHDQTHAVDHAYGRRDRGAGGAEPDADPFENVTELFAWLRGLRTRDYDDDRKPGDQDGKVAVTVQVNGLPPGTTVATEQSGAARVAHVDVGQNYPMGYIVQ